jgi:hypothetical protein
MHSAGTRLAARCSGRALSSTTDFLESLSAHTDWNSEVRALVASAVTNRQHSYAPSLADPLRTQRRPNGVALTTSDEPIGSGRNRTAEVTLKESGRIVLILERVTLERDFPAVAPQRRTSGSGGPGCCSPGPPVSVGIHCGGAVGWAGRRALSPRSRGHVTDSLALNEFFGRGSARTLPSSPTTEPGDPEFNRSHS